MASPLYPLEKIIMINNVETLTYFKNGDPHKPLIIFVPGNAHLARIGYGYPDGNSKDFLAYWINKKGYPFLGISYPIDNKVYQNVYPEFNIDNWGELIIGAANQIIQKNNLSKNIIIIGWSMAGSIVETANEAAKGYGLNLELFIGLSAVPPIPYIMQNSNFKMDTMLPNQLADRTELYAWFEKWLEQQNHYNKHQIISTEIYLSQFLGNIPIALGAEGYHFKNGKFIYDINKTIQESGIFHFSKLPWIALIRDDSLITSKISSIDPYSWYFLLAQMLYVNYPMVFTRINPDSKNIIYFINNLSDELTRTVHGNHLFFVGEKGAKTTADYIDELIHKTKAIKQLFQKNSYQILR